MTGPWRAGVVVHARLGWLRRRHYYAVARGPHGSIPCTHQHWTYRSAARCARRHVARIRRG